jgi:hypothetical protein
MDPFPKPIPPHVARVLAHACEVHLKSPDDFLKVKETLTRIGVASRKDKTLYQSCHILHKQGKYYIVHFKELFLLDGKVAQTQFEPLDEARRNTIAALLHQWGLVELVMDEGVRPLAPPSEITVLPFRQKVEWTLVAKYDVGKKRG